MKLKQYLNEMKIFLDDERKPPSGWKLVKTAEEAIELLSNGGITEISLDHDLGTIKTGYDVILWIEEQAYYGNITIPKITIHTANPVGRRRMEQALKNILRFSK